MEFEYKKRFKKSYKNFPQKLREKFSERLDIFVKNKYDPTLDNHSVEKAYPGCRSIDITGDYRAIFFEERAVLFIDFITGGGIIREIWKIKTGRTRR